MRASANVTKSTTDWHRVNWREVRRRVRNLRRRIFKATETGNPLIRALLEPDAVKVARPVLRGEGSGNAPDLPDPPLV